MNTEEVMQKMTTQTSRPEEQTKVRVDEKPRFTPTRFSVRGLRRHTGLKTSRTPQIAY